MMYNFSMKVSLNKFIIQKSFKKCEYLRQGVYTFNGSVTNEVLSNNFKLPYKDLDLIMSTI